MSVSSQAKPLRLSKSLDVYSGSSGSQAWICVLFPKRYHDSGLEWPQTQTIIVIHSHKQASKHTNTHTHKQRSAPPFCMESIPEECGGVCVWRHAKPPQSCWGVYFCKSRCLRLAITVMRKSLGACGAHFPGYRYACWHMPNPPLSLRLVVNALERPVLTADIT